MLFRRSPYAETRSRCYNPATPQAMISSPHYLATQAGLRILRAGGTALDAAVATGAVLCVVYPHMNGLGGDGFWLIHESTTGLMYGINASGYAGTNVSYSRYLDHGYKAIPPRGILAACTVPGMVSGWEMALELSKRWGSQISLATVLEDAVTLAEEGFPVAPSLARWLAKDCAQRCGPQLHKNGLFARTFLPEGRIPHTGERLRLSALSRSLRSLQKDGLASFYHGHIARQVTDWLLEQNGLLTFTDFDEYHAQWVQPLTVAYRECEACNLPPNSQGAASLALLNICNNLDIAGMGEGSADYIHALVEATKLAFQERDRWLADPAFRHIPLDMLLSPEHGRALARQIRMDYAQPFPKGLAVGGDTCWFGVVDAHGNAVSAIQSLFHDFGSGLMASDTGVILQNRGCFFSLDRRHPNCLEPRKRPLHTLNPPMLRQKGRPVLVYGTMGGEGQPQTQTAIVTRILDFGLSPQDAVAAPRWLYGRSWGAETNGLLLEARFPHNVVQELQRRGHAVTLSPMRTESMGHAGAIWRDTAHDMLWGAADVRGDGLAAGY